MAPSWVEQRLRRRWRGDANETPQEGPALVGGGLRQVDLQGAGWPAPPALPGRGSNALTWGGPASAGFNLTDVQARLSLLGGGLRREEQRGAEPAAALLSEARGWM